MTERDKQTTRETRRDRGRDKGLAHLGRVNTRGLTETGLPNNLCISLKNKKELRCLANGQYNIEHFQVSL